MGPDSAGPTRASLLATKGNRGVVAMMHRRQRRRPIPVTDGERGWGKWPRCTPTARGSNFGRWREGKLTMERAPLRRVVGWRGTARRTSSSGGGDRLGAWREVRSTGCARGGVGGAVPWSEMPDDGGAPVDVAAALDTLPGSLFCQHVGADPCLRKGLLPLRSWTERSRHGGTAHQRRQRGAGALARCDWKSRVGWGWGASGET
jgi:hypothetical protein